MIHFEEKDRQAWLGFLNTTEGAKGIAFLRESHRPSIRSSGAPHEMQFDVGAQSGFDIAIQQIEQLARISDKPQRRTADLPPLTPTRRE